MKSTNLTPCIRNETELVFTEEGAIATFPTFMNCINNIASPKLIPSMFNGSRSAPLQVKTAVQMNNIGNIVPKDAIVELDFYLDLYWTDDRFDMPLYWDRVAPELRKVGVRIERIFYDSAGSFVWLPDIFFHDGLVVSEQGSSILLNASNTFFWQRHMIVTLSQQQFSFEHFPDDEQDITIRYGSFGFDQFFLNLSLTDDPIKYVPNPTISQHQPNFFLNSEWFPVHNASTSAVFLTSNPMYSHNDSSSSSFGYTDAVFIFPVERYTAGIVVRLAIPIAMLLVLGGATFFIDNAEAKIGSTTALLIAVTALYIIILGNIPFVGYATTIDQFILVMLAVLVGIIIVQVVYLLLYNYVYKSEDSHEKDVSQRSVLTLFSSPHYSKPFRYFCDMMCSSSLADDSKESTTSNRGANKKNKKWKKTPASSMWFSSESNEVLGKVCVAAMVLDQREHMQHGPHRGEELDITSNHSFGEQRINESIKEDDETSSSSGLTSRTRDKEIQKPCATFAMLGIEFCGKVFVVPAILLYTSYLMLGKSMRPIAVTFHVVAWVFLAVASVFQGWIIISKYCELYIFTDPFQDKVDTLSTCYDELFVTCLTLLPQQSQRNVLSVDAQLHFLSYDHLQELHTEVLRQQYSWLMKKCLQHSVPTAEELLRLIQRQSRLLRIHDECKEQLLRLATAECDGSDGPELNSPHEQNEINDTDKNKMRQNMLPAGSAFTQSRGHRVLSIMPCEALHTAYGDIMGLVETISHIYPSSTVKKLRLLYRPRVIEEQTNNAESKEAKKNYPQQSKELSPFLEIGDKI